MDADRVRRPEAVVRRRHQLPGPGRHRRPARTGSRRPWPRCTTGSAPTSGCCSSTSCSSPRSTPRTCRTGAPPTRTARGSAPRRRSWSTPATTRRDEHRVHRRDAAAGEEARWLRLQLAVLRRRRPDGRRGRSVPAVPDHVRGAPGGGLDRARGRGVHARPVPQHRAEDAGQVRSVMNVGRRRRRRPSVDRRALTQPQRPVTSSAARACSWTPTTPTSAHC